MLKSTHVLENNDDDDDNDNTVSFKNVIPGFAQMMVLCVIAV